MGRPKCEHTRANRVNPGRHTAGGKVKTRTVKDWTRYEYVIQNKVVAQLDVKSPGGGVGTMKGWTAKVKGKGYGKKLMAYVIDTLNLHFISTDGFTELGAKNITHASNKRIFKIIDWRHGTHSGHGILGSQEYIDQTVEKQEAGRRSWIYIDPKLHSRYNEVEDNG